MDIPLVSVVMGVRNGGEALHPTISSILSQEGTNLEFIIINDGSSDHTVEILEDYRRRDQRIRIHHQEEHGLTRALIRGCTEARGKYIARQDVGDLSFPFRLYHLVKAMESSPRASFVSSGTRFVGPQSEFLYDIHSDPEEATQRLLSLDPNYIRGPSIHGCTMFPKVLYDRVGGYRADFYFAQDLDLWVRLVEYGPHLVIPEVLYQATVRADSITGLYRREQMETAKIIVEASRLRRNGLNEEPTLQKARRIQPATGRNKSRLQRARGLYFIGMCLKVQKNPDAFGYFKDALRSSPFHLKSAFRLIFG